MARDTDVGGGSLAGLWRRAAGAAAGRSTAGSTSAPSGCCRRIAQRPVRLAIMLLVFNRAIGGALYSVTEPDSDWFDGAWWVLVTQTTVGYGDFAPESFLGRATAELVMWTGILAVAILTAALAGVIAERRIEQRQATRRTCRPSTLDDDFDHLIARLESDTQYLAEHLRRLKDVTNDPRVVAALRDANLPEGEGHMKRSKSVNLVVVPLLAAAFLSGLRRREGDRVLRRPEQPGHRQRATATAATTPASSGSSARAGLARGSFAGAGERINSTDKAALAQRGGFGSSARSGGVGRPTGKTIGGGSSRRRTAEWTATTSSRARAGRRSSRSRASSTGRPRCPTARRSPTGTRAPTTR